MNQKLRRNKLKKEEGKLELKRKRIRKKFKIDLLINIDTLHKGLMEKR